MFGQTFIVCQKWYIIVIIWARGICLIYMPKPEGHRPKGAGIYIRHSGLWHAVSNKNRKHEPNIEAFQPDVKASQPYVEAFQPHVKTSQAYIETFQPDVKDRSNLG